MFTYRFALSLLTLVLIRASLTAQLQTADEEGLGHVNTLKKLSKKAQYGASLINKEISFSTGKGIAGTPVVTARESGTVELVSIVNKVPVGYMLPYNQFVKLTDYDFGIYYKNKFRSQKYPPQKVSLTDESVFMDDSYGLVYGYTAEESGQRCRFTYNYEYTDAKYLTRVFFHEHFPVKQTSVSFRVPDWLQLEIIEKNFAGYKVKKEVKSEKNTKIYTYTAESLPGIKQEAASLARPYYLPHLVITVRSYTAGQQQYKGFQTLADMYGWYNFLYGKADNKPEVLKSLVNQLTQGKSSDEEKLKTLYYWVQDNIRYIAFEEGYAGFVPQSVQDVYKNKYGDCKGMANILTEMLKLAGYDAHFAWIGTREIPYDRNEIQSMCVDNHAICVVYLQGKPYFLDGTEKYASFGRNAYRIQGKNVLVQHGDTYKVETVPPPTTGENLISTKASLTLQNNIIKGHVTLTFDGEAKNFFHNLYNNIPAAKRKDFISGMLELQSSNAEATNVKTSDFGNRDIPLVMEGDIEISNQVTQVDKLCYTRIDFFPGAFAGFVPEDDRQNPIDLGQVMEARDEVTLELPANASLQAAPAPFQSAFQQNNIDVSYTGEGRTVVLKKTMRLATPVVDIKDFTEWKTFLNKIKEYNRNNVTIKLQ